MFFDSKQVFNNVLEAIGRTPLVRLNSVVDGLPCNIYVKLEYLNPGGSIKDRIGSFMIDEAERSGRLKPGGVIVESTSGNTGVGLAISAALKGYKCIFVMADKQSQSKVEILRAFGAEVIVTPTAVEPEDPRSYYSVAKRLVEETPNAILANQYHNPENPRTHYVTTGPEIWEQIGDRLTHFVAGLGTGGTVTGVSRYLKEQNPDIRIIGVDPEGSILLDLHQGREGQAENYKVEGIGEDFLPSSLSLDAIDEIVRVNDQECFLMARRLVREEGVFTGGSGGGAVAGAVKYAREAGLTADDTLVVILPDSGSRYMSKVFNDNWMRENGFMPRPRPRTYFASDVQGAKGTKDLITVREDASMEEVVKLMKEHGISQAPVVDTEGRLAGVVTELALLNHLLDETHDHQVGEPIAPIVNRDPLVISADTPMNTLMQKISASGLAIMTDDDSRITGILTKIDLLDFLAGQMD